MNYYVTDGKDIVARVTDIDPEPPQKNQPLNCSPDRMVSGKEIYIVDVLANLYFVKIKISNAQIDRQSTYAVHGVVTEIGRGDTNLISLAIKRFEHGDKN